MAQPLIAVCGTTGVGKSKLAIELALHLAKLNSKHGWKGARIINADSMQVYAGMDIITNKIPEGEMQNIEHLLIGYKQPGEQYKVGHWVQDAIQAIQETHDRRQVPIIVGGTSYWIQHLMFPNRLAQSDTNAPPSTVLSDDLTLNLSTLSPHLRNLFDNLPEHPPSASSDPTSAFSLHALLSGLDSTVAARWHWKDTRKVLRSLWIIKETGRRPSEIIRDQSEDTLKPRYRTLCLWLYAEPLILDIRLNSRIDEMIKQGLLNEIRSLREIATSAQASDSTTDYTLGIYQTIGYKEFHNYLTSPTPSETVFNNAVDEMKLSTRKYAKRQISWIRNKLLPAIYEANSEEKMVPAYLLDATELGESWISNVLHPAMQISKDFLEFNELPDPFGLSERAKKMLTIDKKPIEPNAVLNARRKIICPICTVDKEQPCMLEEGREWEAHQKTRLHKRLARKPRQELGAASGIEERRDQRAQERNESPTSSCDLDDTIFQQT